jgi:O-antigen/teichoic acid export membrane protein
VPGAAIGDGRHRPDSRSEDADLIDRRDPRRKSGESDTPTGSGPRQLPSEAMARGHGLTGGAASHRRAANRAGTTGPIDGRPDSVSRSVVATAAAGPMEQTKRDLQMAGMAMLMSLATSVTVGGPFPVSPGPAQVDPRPRSQTVAAGSSTPPDVVPSGKLGALTARLRTDHLVRNSLYLILSTAVQAGLGFAFWIIAARLFSTADVGRASSLISAAILVAFLALLGLNSTFVRFLPIEPNRDALITAGILLVGVCGAAIGLAYVLLTPLIAPKLAFVAHNPVLAVGFVLLAAAAAVNLLTDSIFIAVRKAGYNAAIDGGIGGLAKLVSCVALVGTGAYGLFCASVGGFAVAALASLVLMTKVLRWRPTLRSSRQALWPLLRFSGANYAGNMLNMLPTLVVPLIVLDREGAPAAAYYFVAFQTVTLLYSGAAAVEQAFLAEGAHDGVVGRELRRRSLRLVMALCVPAWLVLTVAAHWIMLAFGVRYSLHATDGLIVLAAAAVPLALMNWSLTLLRLSGHLRAIVVSNAVYVAAISGVAWILAPRGLTAVCAAWPIGALLATITAGVAALTTVSRAANARHRRAPQPRGA